MDFLRQVKKEKKVNAMLSGEFKHIGKLYK